MTEDNKAMQWAIKSELVADDKKKFSPSMPLTQAQFAKMYAEFFQFPAVPGIESTKNKYGADIYYKRLQFYGVPLSGIKYPALRNKEISRGVFAQLIAFAHGKPHDLTSAVTHLMDTGISSGDTKKTGNITARFEVNKPLTGKQAITFLYRMSKNNLAKIDDRVLMNAGVDKINPSVEYAGRTSLFIGGEVTAYFLNEKPLAYEIAFVAHNKLLGGYLTKIGQKFNGFTIGQAHNGNSVIVQNGRTITLMIDKHDQNKIKAIYWTYQNEVIENYMRAMINDTSKKKIAAHERLMIDITNVSRAQNGLPLLKANAALANVARDHSVDMNKNNYFAHQNLSDLSAGNRIKNGGISYKFWGENISKGYSTIFHSHNGLMNSEGHRKNILNSKFDQVGIGIHYRYYTINFLTAK